MRRVSKIKKGAPVAENWRTVNEAIDELDRHDDAINTLRAAIAELRTRPRDVGLGGVTVCDPDTGEPVEL